MLKEDDMYPNGKRFKERIEVHRSGVDREEQGRLINHIGLNCSEHSIEYRIGLNQIRLDKIRSYWSDKI